MTPAETKLTFKCTDPACGRLITMKRPAKSGVYAVTCPHCGVRKQFRLTGIEEIPVTRPPQPQSQSSASPQPQSGSPAASAPQPAKTMAVNFSGTLQTAKGKLTLKRRFRSDKDFPLKEGRNTVGRYDGTGSQEIPIKGDDSMSRRSVEIAMTLTGRGYEFRMTVMRAANPVFHNGTPLKIGESVELGFGDTIVLGKTKLIFGKCE